MPTDYSLRTRLSGRGINVVANRRFALASDLLGRPVVDFRGRTKKEAFIVARLTSQAAKTKFCKKVSGSNSRLREKLERLAKSVREDGDARNAFIKELRPWWTAVSASRASFEKFYGISPGDDRALARRLGVRASHCV